MPLHAKLVQKKRPDEAASLTPPKVPPLNPPVTPTSTSPPPSSPKVAVAVVLRAAAADGGAVQGVSKEARALISKSPRALNLVGGTRVDVGAASTRAPGQVCRPAVHRLH